MFEKEAFNYGMTYAKTTLLNTNKELEQAYKDGAEFGYKEGIKTLDDMTRAFNREHKKYTDLRIANEWHYVKDKDYPKDNKPVLCILGDIDSENCEVGYYNDVGSGKPWHFETYHLPDDDGDNAWGVYAWKEIILP